ncbi:hypothetical protein CY34DRAFT_800941 [Suillus luteus UH-Slu-Lm8-n1]|uniref:Uncharacterized protein n=1 Tax=Suillus luteus UH-Slu-Lm8-n1 TaxID=930992 RepID=A0A0D0BJI0_9AGAM|nr:hypothetical protein CY34DRAFT_800941 [Suillus luteus UH-Slu-Lm8-n1]
MYSALSRSSTTISHLQQEQVLYNAASTIRRPSVGGFYEEFKEESHTSDSIMTV